MRGRRAIATAALAAGLVWPAIPQAKAAPVVVHDQVGDWVIPFSRFQAAAAEWPGRVVMVYGGGPPYCGGPDVICETPLPAHYPGLPGTLLGLTWPDGSITLSPALNDRLPSTQIAVIAHELGNLLGVPETPCGSGGVMSRCL